MNGTLLSLVTWSVLFVLVGVVLLAATRFFTLRSRGASVLLRHLPAKGIHGWRHGVIRYAGDHAEYFKLRSLVPGYDLRLNRLDIEVVGHRTVSDDEASFISTDMRAVHVKVGAKEYEIAFDLHGEMAFMAWIESAPSKRMERVDYRRLRERAERKDKASRRNAEGDYGANWPTSYDR